MPKIFMKYPRGTFPADSLDLLAEGVTTHALAFEKLPNTPYVRSNVSRSIIRDIALAQIQVDR
jgi:hypothetical protein